MKNRKTGATPRTIKQVIEKKIRNWLKTLPNDIHKDVEKHLIVTGGCIASMLLGESIRDFDIYFDDKITAYRLTSYYVNLFNKLHPTNEVIPHITSEGDRLSIYIKSAGVVSTNSSPEEEYHNQEDVDLVETNAYQNKESYKPVFLSENAISLSDKIQLVIRFIGSPEEIHKNYDYVHVTNYYYTRDKELVLNSKALSSLLSKTLWYQGSLYPICSLFRLRKFLKRGWNISAGEITKMAIQISQLDLSNVDVLKEQLIGVDIVYFRDLISMIEEYKKEAGGNPLEASYVIQLIDKLTEA